MLFLDLISFFSKEKHPANLTAICLLVESSSSVTYESLKKTLKIHPKTMLTLMTFLEEDILEKKEEFYFIRNINFLDKSKNPETEIKSSITPNPSNLPVMLKINYIFHHLNEITGKNFRPTTNTTKSIQKFLLLGHSPESFILVNQYFSVAWNNPKMMANINPSTLYNGKFPERIQIAENYFGIIQKNREYVYSFIEFFLEEYSKHISSEKKYIFTNEDMSSLLFWLNAGYDVDQIKSVVAHIMKEWSVDPKFKQYLVPNIIFNAKWPTRVNTFKNAVSSIITVNSSILQRLIETLQNKPNISMIDSYNSFYLKSDNALFDHIVENLSTYDKNCSIRLTPFLTFLNSYKQEAEKRIYMFLDNLHNRGERTSSDETRIVLDFVEWFGGWKHFQETDHYLWKNSIKGFIGSI